MRSPSQEVSKKNLGKNLSGITGIDPENMNLVIFWGLYSPDFS